jgi:hypothetical protein
MDVTDVEASQVIEYAATRDAAHLERRAGVTYLVEER